jgi:DNA-binding response OmpR family regulator
MAEQKTILLVDDDRELIDGLRTLLEKQGFRVMIANDGHQAKNAIYNHPVLEHFRGKTDAPPMIMITANEGSRHKAYAEYLGVIDYIRKPFAMERLLETVNKAFTTPRLVAAEAVSEETKDE